MARTNFTDRQKAEIYTLDRATCAYSGRSLWLLDHGIDGKYIADWAEHIKPSSRSGASQLDNGVCASWFYNYTRGTGISAPLLFYRGKPTPAFLFIYDQIPEAIASNLHRFGKLHYSDWYLNRAIWRFCLGLHWLNDCKMGQKRSRGDKYYARASYKILTQWRSIVAREKVSSLEDRGIISSKLTPDEKMLLRVREASSENDLKILMKELLPFHEASCKVWESLDDFLSGNYSRSECESVVEAASDDEFLTDKLRVVFAANVSRLFCKAEANLAPS
jgi:hypothetical protein